MGLATEGIGGQPPRERRPVTLLFADVRGYTSWTEAADMEEVAVVMDRIKAEASRIILTYGGVVNQFVGDEVVAVFGFPSAHEDDTRRAVGAALALHRYIEAIEARDADGTRRNLRFHTGIEFGEVLIGARDPRNGVFDVTGNAVNQAARLRAEARVDEILIGEGAVAQIEGFFNLVQLPERALKGVKRSVVPHRVLGRTNVRSVFDVAVARGLTAHVGRDEEHARLDAGLQRALDGLGHLAVVEGNAGVGKTRLLHELQQTARRKGFGVLHGQCQSYGDVPPFQPFVETLQDALRIRDQPRKGLVDKVVERSAELGVSAHVPVYLYLLGLSHDDHVGIDELEGKAMREAVCEGLSDALIACCAERPVLVLVEDWHWADEASDAAVWHIARRTKKQRILCVFSLRPDEMGNRKLPGEELVLEPLNAEATQAMLQALLGGGALPHGLGSHVHALSAGNPFFVQEITQALLSRELLVNEGGRWLLTRALDELALPLSVAAMVQARIDRLVSEDREILKVASVIGQQFTPELLEALQDDAGDVQLDRLQREALLQREVDAGESVQCRFSHAIVRDVAYSVLLMQRRRELHGKLGEILEQRYDRDLSSHYEVLAHHYGSSDEVAKARRFAELAGDKAARAHSLEQAARQYLQAIKCLDRMAETQDHQRHRVDLSLKWAAACVHNPDPGQRMVLERSRELAEKLDYTWGLARCLCWLGWIEYCLGDHAAAVSYNERCLAMEEALDDSGLLAQVRGNVGMSYACATEYTRALHYLDDAVAERRRIGHSVAPASGAAVAGGGFGYALGHLGLVHGDRGDFGRAYQHFDEGLAAIRARGRLVLEGAIWTQRAMVEAWQGAWAQCRRSTECVADIAEHVDGAFLRAIGGSLDGYSRYHAEADPAGIDLLRDAAVFLERNDIRLVLSFCQGCLAEVLALEGDWDAALAFADRALLGAQRWDGFGQVMALRARGLALAGRSGSAAAADEAMLLALEVAAKKRSPREEAITRMYWSRLLGRSSRSRADFLSRQAVAAFEELDMPWYLEQAKRTAD